MRRLILSVLCVELFLASASPAQVKDQAVEELAAGAKKSLAVITSRGRDGKRAGIGTGFVVAADGLIATNLHVIGEGRAITVELSDGKKYEATFVHASDRKNDLAVVRIDAKGLTPLELTDSEKLKDGQAVVAMGNPQGLKYSVVAGVVSGKREIDGRPMLQVAIPVEPGNSGGPLLDMKGRVVGVMTIKSLVTANLGFAVSSNAVKALLDKPNPVAMKGWMTIGALDEEEWEPTGGASWRQRAGRILVEGAGGGFGGRSLCLSKSKTPALPFEVAVAVKLDDEAGAAGLAFHSDGGDRHYGFYPTSGKLRFTRFDGADVLSWKVIKDQPIEHYRPGEWNILKVRVDKGKFRCFVNDELAFEVEDEGLTEGRVGLVKFRDTSAAFRGFKTGKEIAAAAVPAKVAERVVKAAEALPARGLPKPELIEKLVPDGPAGLAALRERAAQLEQQAAQLRKLALAVHQQAIFDELDKVLRKKEAEIDLIHAALLLAKLDNDEVDLDAYRAEVERLATKVKAALPEKADEAAKVKALNKFLFTDRGFHGSRGDYYHRSNSYLTEVIDDREGLPITLSVLYIELARRLGLDVVGIGLPGHFVVQHRPAKGEPTLLDVFEGGAVMTREAAAKKVESTSGIELRDEHLKPVTKRAVVVRMLHNLLRVAREEKDAPGALRYLDGIIRLQPDSVDERAMRAGLRFQAGNREGALVDVDWLMEKQPEGIDLDRLRQFRRLLVPPK